ncbi:biotin--[acetyl-CoA-carboxylase] ligase [Hutsoniella sourekii]
MDVKLAILNHLLQNGENGISGQVLADQLKVSRNSIWKAVQQLREDGFDIQSSPQAGYHIKAQPKHIHQTYLQSLLASVWPQMEVHYQPCVDSTNKWAKDWINDHPGKEALFIAGEQTAGRGRYGRDFYSKLDHGLYLSLVFQPSLPLEEIAIYTLLTAVAAYLTLKEYRRDQLAIKWVNDLYLNQKKIIGILCEAIADLENGGLSAIIVGIGFNLAGDFRQADLEISKEAGVIFSPEEIQKLDTNRFLVQFIKHFRSLDLQLPDKSFLQSYQEAMLGIGHEVEITLANQKQTGTLRGINQQGALILEDSNGKLQAYASGECRLSKEKLLGGHYD